MCVPLSLAAKLAPASIRVREIERDSERKERKKGGKRGKKRSTMCRFPKTPLKKTYTNASAFRHQRRERACDGAFQSAAASLPTASRLLSRTNETHAGQHTTNGGPWERKKEKKRKNEQPPKHLKQQRKKQDN